MESITKEQFLANAELNAREFQNRQVLIVGQGAPDFQAPRHIEYEDEATVPSTRYRKTGMGINEWTDISLQRVLGLGSSTDSYLELIADDSAPGVSFSITLPYDIPGNQGVDVVGFGAGALLSQIKGGVPGQVIRVQRAEAHHLLIHGNANLKLTADLFLADVDQLDNITMQRINATTWVELARTTF